MKNLFLTLLSFVLCFNLINAQSWQKIYGSSKFERVGDLRVTSDGGAIMVGTRGDDSYSDTSEIILTRVDKDGLPLWSKQYTAAAENFGWSVELASDGGFLIGGNAPIDGPRYLILMKTDAEGNLLWSRKVTGFAGVSDIRSTPDNGFVILSQTTDGFGFRNLLFLKVDQAGTLLWSKIIGHTENNAEVNLEIGNDGSILAVGSTNVNVGYDVSFIKLSPAGDVVFSKRYEMPVANLSSASAIRQNPSGYLVAGYAYSNSFADYNMQLMQLDISGNILWTKEYGAAGDERAYDLHLVPGGEILLVGEQHLNSSHYTTLVRLDGSGKIVSSYGFNNDASDQNDNPRSKFNNGNLYLANHLVSPLGFGKQDFMLMKYAADRTNSCRKSITLSQMNVTMNQFNVEVNTMKGPVPTSVDITSSSNSIKYNALCPTIKTGSISALVLVSGQQISVPYSVVGTFFSGNIFTAELSDENGNFSNPITIGSRTSTSSGTITATIPADAVYGSRYRIRVVGSNPYAAGTDNGHNIVILAADNFIAAGSSWKYLDNGSNQGDVWQEISFNDSGWKTGNAELGYGDGDEATRVSFGPSSTNKYITTYFRKTFSVADADKYTTLNLEVLRDDGVVVYLNGHEIYRNNMPSGAITFTTRASVAIDGSGEKSYHKSSIPSSLLVDGTNVVAVEIHQNNPSSSDISFNLKLSGSNNPTCVAEGKILREVWIDVPGDNVYNIPVHTSPETIEYKSVFQGPTNVSDNYGARYRGYICAPITGYYTFYISSDDDSELYLSTDRNPDNKTLIAHVYGYTKPLEWYKYSSQKGQVLLAAGESYYIEALHKEQTGGDNFAVGWKMPDGKYERPIGGNRLSPLIVNNGPSVAITSPKTGDSFKYESTITIQASASDADGTITKVEFYERGSKIGEDSTAPYEISYGPLHSGYYSVIAVAYDDDGRKSNSENVYFNVRERDELIREYSYWNYLDNGSNQGTAWRNLTFDDSSWKMGQTELGYGDGDEVTTVSYGPSATNKYITTYFRRKFFAENVSSMAGVDLQMRRDDGAVVYLNGVEVFRTNMPGGEINYTTTASSTIDGSEETNLVSANISPSFLIEGENVIAVEIHQRSPSSSDITFMLILRSLHPSTRLASDSTAKLTNTEFFSLVYPNPNTGQFWIEARGITNPLTKMEIVNLLGEVVYRETFKSEGKILRRNISAPLKSVTGIYFVKVSNGDKVWTEKIIITK